MMRWEGIYNQDILKEHIEEITFDKEWRNKKMRLIDADVLEDYIKNNVCTIGKDKILLTAGDDGRWHELLDCIPTAYDLDKVEEQLDIPTAYDTDAEYTEEEKAIIEGVEFSIDNGFDVSDENMKKYESLTKR